MTITISGTSGVTYPAGGTDNVAGAGVGTTDTQTLTNKTLTSPTLNTATINSFTSPNLTEQSTVGFKNRIINGAMVIDQRNAGASISVTSGLVFPVDRTQVVVQAATGSTAQRSTTAPAGFTNSLAVTVGTGASPTAAQQGRILHIIEGLNVADLAWGTASAATVTLSFWVRSSVTGTFAGGLYGGQGYVFTYVINSANTWEYKTVTIPGSTSGTWSTDTSPGVNVNFDLGSGTSFQVAAGSWGAGAVWATSTSVKLCATTGATFYVTGVQLEKGSTATSFDYRPYGTELMLCQRYFEKSFAQGTAPANGASATALSTTDNAIIGMAQNQLNAGATVFYKVTKRASPTVTLYGNSSGQWLYAAQSATSWTGSASGTPKNANDSSFIVDQQVVNATAIFVMGHYTSSAEL